MENVAGGWAKERVMESGEGVIDGLGNRSMGIRVQGLYVRVWGAV